MVVLNVGGLSASGTIPSSISALAYLTYVVYFGQGWNKALSSRVKTRRLETKLARNAVHCHWQTVACWQVVSVEWFAESCRRDLELYANQLTAFPDTISLLVNLQTINAPSNLFTTFPAALGQLPALR